MSAPGDAHQCNICSKSFSRAAILRDHIRRHGKEKPFQCQTCDKAFANKSDLKRHEDSHAGRKFQCERCNREFTRRLAITTHICTNSVYKPVAKSIEHEPAHRYIVPSSTFRIETRDASKPSSGKPYDGSIRQSQRSVNSHLRTIPLGMPPPSANALYRPMALPTAPRYHTSEVYEPMSSSSNHDNSNDNDDCPSPGGAHESDYDSDMSSVVSDHSVSAMPEPSRWEDPSHKCCICPAQYSSLAPFARHLVHHLEELDLRPYRCTTCCISFAFQAELVKHEVYDQREQQESNLSLPCIWNCGKVFASADACREHISAASDARCKVGMALESHLRITVLQQFKSLLAPEAGELLQAMQKIVGSDQLGYKPRSLDMGWFHQMITGLDSE